MIPLSFLMFYIFVCYRPSLVRVWTRSFPWAVKLRKELQLSLHYSVSRPLQRKLNRMNTSKKASSISTTTTGLDSSTVTSPVSPPAPQELPYYNSDLKIPQLHKTVNFAETTSFKVNEDGFLVGPSRDVAPNIQLPLTPREASLKRAPVKETAPDIGSAPGYEFDTIEPVYEDEVNHDTDALYVDPSEEGNYYSER